jgi:hypothetical protein
MISARRAPIWLEDWFQLSHTDCRFDSSLMVYECSLELTIGGAFACRQSCSTLADEAR